MVFQTFFFAIIGLFSFATLLCLIYSIPIVLLKQFRRRRHMITFNISSTIISFSTIHIVYLTNLFYYPKVLANDFSCNLITYLRVMITFQLAFSLVIASIHRLFYFLYYPKRFFKSKLWLGVCIGGQWFTGCVLSLIFLASNGPVRICL